MGSPSNATSTAAGPTGPSSSSAARLLWELRLTSLWSPVTALVAVFAPYVVLVQLAPSSTAWALPLMRGWAMAMVVAFAALGIARLAFGKFRRLRHLRIEAQEALMRLKRQQAAIDALGSSARDSVKERIAALEAAQLERNPDALADALKKLTDLSDKHVSKWRNRTAMEGWGGLVLTLLGVLALRTVIVEPFKIPSGSMLPTLQIGDHVVVNRFIYGVRLPYLNVVPFVIVRKPARGDVIVFENPLDNSKDFIKRVIGLPGDRIEIIDERLWVNGQIQPRTEIAHGEIAFDSVDGEWVPQRADRYDEDLTGHVHALYQTHSNLNHHWGPYQVPEGNVFVMGDNRDNSADSRLGFGVRPDEVAFVPFGNIKGKAMVIWLALGHQGLGSSLFGGTGLRTERLFEPVR